MARNSPGPTQFWPQAGYQLTPKPWGSELLDEM